MKRKNIIVLTGSLSALLAWADMNSSVLNTDLMAINLSSQIGSAYQLYGAMFNDEPYWAYSTSVDFEIPDSCSIGVGSWTMNDLTTTHKDFHPRWNNETDIDVHLFRCFYLTESIAINAYLGHVWFLFHSKERWASQRSFVWGVELDNPILTPTLNFEYEYAYLPALYMEGGVKRRFQIGDRIHITPSFSMSAMGENFKYSFFPSSGKSFQDGLCAVFAKLKGEWRVISYMTLYAQITYCTILDEDIRKGIDSVSSTYKKDFATIEAGVSLSF